MTEFSLTAELREKSGKGVSRKLRASSRIPAVIYGSKEDTISLSLDRHDVEVLLQRIGGEKVIVKLQYGDHNDNAFIRRIQRDPASEKLLHLDFFRLNMKEKLDTRIHVTHTGKAAGVAEGGILSHGVTEVEIRCLPGDVPPHLEVDVTKLNIGDAITIGDLTPPKGVEFLSPEESVLFTVLAKSTEEPETPVAEGEEAEAESAESEPV